MRLHDAVGRITDIPSACMQPADEKHFNTSYSIGMNRIISKEYFSERVVKLVVEAPLIAKARRAGHFVIVRVGEKGERIPLTIAEADTQAGTITLVVQSVG